jgi:hypothetical protein
MIKNRITTPFCGQFEHKIKYGMVVNLRNNLASVSLSNRTFVLDLAKVMAVAYFFQEFFKIIQDYERFINFKTFKGFTAFLFRIISKF